MVSCSSVRFLGRTDSFIVSVPCSRLSLRKESRGASFKRSWTDLAPPRFVWIYRFCKDKSDKSAPSQSCLLIKGVQSSLFALFRFLLCEQIRYMTPASHPQPLRN